jgi:hypothetical protein
MKCITISDIFSNDDCQGGTVFELPCPASFVAVNHVEGLLIVEPDPAFGGGELLVSGTVDGTKPNVLQVDNPIFKVESADRIHLLSGVSVLPNSSGGKIRIAAGDNDNEYGGTGGSVSLSGGDVTADSHDSNGSSTNGTRGNGGAVSVRAGGGADGKGGNLLLAGGTSQLGVSGAVHVCSGGGDRGSGAVEIATANAAGATSSGEIRLRTGLRRCHRRGRCRWRQAHQSLLLLVLSAWRLVSVVITVSDTWPEGH